MELNLSVLGRFELSIGAKALPAPSLEKARALLAFLVMQPGIDVSRERILELFWPDADPERARGNLNTALWSARRCFREAGRDPDQFVIANKSTVRWVAEVHFDVAHFIALANDPNPNRQHTALALYKGDFLEGCYDDWSVAERERISGIFEALLNTIVKQSHDVGAAQRLISRNPYGEDAYAVLIDSELSAGRPFAAAAIAEKCRSALKEVGAVPSSAFEERYGSLERPLPATADTDVLLRLPFVGREAELAALDAAFVHATAGEGSIILLHGEAGIGKSALLTRAVRVAGDRSLRLVLIPSGEQDIGNFGPWPNLFETLTGGDFSTFLSSPSGNTAIAIAERLHAALPAKGAVFLDDAHQLRGEALDVLGRFVYLAAASHAIVIGLRPEALHQLRALLANVRHEELALGPLAREAWESALMGVVGDEQIPLLDAVYERTEGHPLFFCGLIQSLVQKGTILRTDGRWRIATDHPPTLELPPTLKSFIETRLRARGEDAAAVACALALEPTASSQDIADALGVGEERVLDAMDDLIALGLVTQPAIGPQFQLSHDLVREVAGALLNAGRRARLHRSFAELLERRGAPGSAVRRAGHLALCQDHVGAGEASAAAADEALASRAALDALDRCDTGITALASAVQTEHVRALTARLQQLQAVAFIEIGHAQPAVDAANGAVSSGRDSVDAHQMGYLLLTRAEAYGIALRPDYQLRDCAELLELSKVLHDDSLRARALCLAADAHRMQGSASEALDVASNASDIAVGCGDWQAAAIAACGLLRAQLTWWRFAEIPKTLERGFKAAAKAGPHAESALTATRALLWHAVERHDNALRDLEMAKSLASSEHVERQQWRKFGSSWHQLFFLIEYTRSVVAAADKRWDEALGAEALPTRYSGLLRGPAAGNAVLLVRIDAMLGRNAPSDTERASALASELRASPVAQSEFGWSDCSALALARIAARLRAVDAAVSMRRALDVLEGNGHRTPLLVDRAFETLACTAQEVRVGSITARARERSQDYRDARMAAMGSFSGYRC